MNEARTADRPRGEGYGIDPAGGCTLANLRAGVDPIGTATPFDDLFLMQVPPPWPAIALHSDSVPAGLQAALAPLVREGRKIYGLLVDADGAEPPPPGTLRFIHVRRPEGAARAFELREFLVPSEEAPAAFASLASGDGPGVAREVEAFSGRQLLVCTHGSRDGCCGSFGEGAYRYLEDRHAAPDLRIWRVSHFGGHRFAPTLIDLPDGRCWGWLTARKIDALVERDLPVSRLLGSYRGWCAIPNELQVAERDLFERYGWRWPAAELAANLSPEAASGHRATLRYRLPGREEVVREAILERLPDTVEAPASCGAQASLVSRYTCTWR